MKAGRDSLGLIGSALVIAAFLLGVLATGLWLRSDARWADHLTRAYYSGEALYSTLMTGLPAPDGVTLTALTSNEQELANRGMFAQLPGVPRPAFVTNVSIIDTPAPGFSGNRIEIAVVAPKLQYPVADITRADTSAPQATFGALTRILASYCSEPIVFAHREDKNWVRIDGASVWGCAAAPDDLRLAAALIGLVGIAIILTLLLNVAAKFSEFAALLRSRVRLGGPERYDAEGPSELRDIVDAVNSYLNSERERLEKRVSVLSGVSHDMGTPATRMRLRAELIDDPELRAKVQTDIDQLTGIIESVLTYTRAEIGTEDPRQISLTSLVESLVADYSDIGKPVSFLPESEEKVTGSRSVFMSLEGRGVLPEDRHVLVTARPVSLQRALSNLIDNALKYGRTATVSLRADAETATILVEDEGNRFSPADIEALIAPYQRGANTSTIPGFGLGLTIVASIANLHGGELTFVPGKAGIRARLVIRRQ